jgi:hypothetical protein
MRRWILGAAALASGCGGSLIDEPIRSEPLPTAEVAAVQKPSPPPGALFRQDVDDAVEEGLGYFLQRVTVDPDLAGGKFQGFRIVELRPVEYWQGVDLKPGDVVTKVNGLPIERDIDAYQVFQGLRAAPELRVTFTRGGAQRELVYAIVDRDGKKPATRMPVGAPARAPAPNTPDKPPAAKPTGAG